MHHIQFSGYDQKDRQTGYIKSVTKNLVRIGRQDAAVTHRRCTGKYWNKWDRTQKKIVRKDTWYGMGKYQEVNFVECTPNGELACRGGGTLKDNNQKIKVIEKPGKS